MREAVLETRVDGNGRALVLFRGAPLQGCSGLEISAAVKAIAAWAAANNGVVRMHTMMPDGTASEDLIHGDGTVVPAMPASGRRAAVQPHPQAPQPRIPQVQQAPGPQYGEGQADPRGPALQVQGRPVPQSQQAPEPQYREQLSVPQRVERTDPPAAPYRPAPLQQDRPREIPLPEEPFTGLRERPSADVPRPPRSFSESLEQSSSGRITSESLALASWRAPLEDDEEVFDVESPAAPSPKPATNLRRNLIRAAALILIAALAILMGIIFTTPGPGAPAAGGAPAITVQRVSAVTEAPGAGPGSPIPENPMLTLAVTGGLAVAAASAGGLAVLKVVRSRKTGTENGWDEDLLPPVPAD